MLIDFNGLPGCGKSTVARELLSLLSDQSRKCLFLQTEIERVSKRKLTLLFLLVKSIFSSRIKILFIYFRLLAEFKNGGIKLAINAWKNYCICFSSAKANDTIIIADQFVIQSILSCYYDVQIKDFSGVRKLVGHAERDFRYCLFVDVECSSETAAQRIAKRKTHGGRLDDLEINSLKAILETQIHNLDFIKQSVNRAHVITIDSSDTPALNSRKIEEMIKESKK